MDEGYIGALLADMCRVVTGLNCLSELMNSSYPKDVQNYLSTSGQRRFKVEDLISYFLVMFNFGIDLSPKKIKLSDFEVENVAVNI